MAHCLPRSLSTLLLACLATARAGAAELGDARVSSYAGQQLVADIELTSLENPAVPVQVRLAHPDVYRGANIAVPAVLSSLNLAVMQRNGKQFLHLTSLRPVDGDHLHLYLELVDGTHRSVRLSTLWLGADPNPAPPAVAVAAARDEAAGVPAATLPRQPASAAAPTPVSAPAPARPREHVPAPAPASAPPAAPAPSIVRAAPSQPAMRIPARLAAPVLASQLPVVKPAACTPQPSDEAKACIALDSKSTALRVQIAQLEQKVKALQGAVHGGSGAAAVVQPAVHAPAPTTNTASKPTAPAGPAPILPQKRRKPAQAEHEADMPWLAIGIGAGVLAALAGALVMIVRRRRKPRHPAPSIAVSRDGIKSRLMPGP
jgi:hypothetical protein